MPLRVLSLGAGVQSSTLLLMSCSGVLPKLDIAIFADTQWESKAVYDHLDYLEVIARSHGIPVIRVSAGDLRADALRSKMRRDEYEQIDGGRWASLPLFTQNRDGTVGRIKRQCTKEYKLEPIRREIARQLQQRGIKKTAGCVEQWIGISRDEMRRARISDVGYIVNRYPLIFDMPMTRAECLQWIEDNDFQIPPRSACLGCPNKTDGEWRRTRNNPDEWVDVVEFDSAIRSIGGLRGATYLHRSCAPIDDVDLRTAEERGQSNWLEECTGLCGN